MAFKPKKEGGRDGKFRRGEGSRDKSRLGDTTGPRKRTHYLDGVKEILPTDYELLRKFVTEHGKIVPSRLTGASSKQQRKIKRGIRRARNIGIVA